MPPNLKSQLLDVKKMLRLILGTSMSKPTMQWAGQEVSKGKLGSRKAASEVYLQFGINLSHTPCAKAAEDEGAPPKKRGKATFVPPDVESKLVDFCIALRSLNFPIFKEELIGYCNTFIQVPGEKNSPLKIREIFGKILGSQNETLQNVSKPVGYDSYSNTLMYSTQKGLSNKKNGL